MNTVKIWAHEGFCVEKNTVWFVPLSSGILCGYDTTSSKLTFVKILCDNIYDIDRFYNTIKIENYIVTVPSFDDTVKIYDIKKDVIYDYKLTNTAFGNHYMATVYNNTVLVFPFNSISMVKISISDDKPVFEEIELNENGFVSCIQLNKKIYLLKKNNGIYTYDNDKISPIASADSNIMFTDMALIDEDKLLLLDNAGRFFVFSISKREIVKLFDSNTSYYSIAIRDGFVYAFPNKSGDFFDKYNIENMKLCERYAVKQNATNDAWPWDAYSKAIVCDGKIYVMNIFHQCLMRIDENDAITYYSIDYPDVGEDVKANSLKHEMEKGFLTESSMTGIDLPFFVSLLRTTEKFYSEESHANPKSIDYHTCL